MVVARAASGRRAWQRATAVRSTEVEPGRYLTLSFDVTRGTVVGVFSTENDYPVAADCS